jgi:hypothetical protein
LVLNWELLFDEETWFLIHNSERNRKKKEKQRRKITARKKRMVKPVAKAKLNVKKKK